MVVRSTRPWAAGITLRTLITGFIILTAMFLASSGYEFIGLNSIDKNWLADSVRIGEEFSSSLQRSFNEYQNDILRIVRGVADTPALRDLVTSNDDSTTLALFDFLQAADTRGSTIEVFDDAKRSLAWTGNRGPAVDTACLTGEPVSYVRQGAIYTWVIVAVPVGDPAKPVGYCVAKRLFDVNFPINNRFVSNTAFQSTFRTDIAVDFDFPADTTHRNSAVFAVPLMNLSGTIVGTAEVQRPSIDVMRDQLSANVRSYQVILSLLLTGLLLITLHGLMKRKYGSGTVLASDLFSLWIFRYLLVWFDIPGRLIRIDIFNPRYFASSFGEGLARSLGDLAISSAVLLLTVIALAGFVRERRITRLTPSGLRSSGSRIFGIIGISVIIILILSAIRGYGATLRSAVFDSSLPFNDPASVVPTFELSVMLISLLMITISLVLAVTTAINGIVSRLRGIYVTSVRDSVLRSTTVIILFGGSILYGVLVSTPLFGQWSRLAIIVLLSILAFWMERKGRPVTVRELFVCGALSALIIVQTLDHRLHDLDRARAETIARDLQRPEDSWLRFLVSQTLGELSDSVSAEILLSGNPADIEKLAFRNWARSILSREGNNCAVTYYDASGKNVSSYHLGVLPRSRSDTSLSPPPASQVIQSEFQTQGGTSFKVYSGAAALHGPDGTIAGSVRVEVSGGRQLLLRGEGSELLRTLNRDDLSQHFRPMTVSVYFQGKLLSSTDETLALSRSLPSEIAVAGRENGGIWLTEVANGEKYESYYLPDETDQTGRTWLSLSMPVQGVRWHLYVYLRYFIFFLALGALFFLGILAGIMVRRKPIVAGFRTKLLIAFVVVSVLPVIIMAYYNRQYSAERRSEWAVRRLNSQTSVVVAELQRRFGISVPAGLADVTDDQCAGLANNLNTEFNVYFGSGLQASSKPEMFKAELLDSTLSASAFNHLFLRRERFYSEPQSIGSLPFIVGYRPLLAEDGSVIGVVSVPSLYRQSEVDEDLARRNVFLYGAYAVALMLSFLVGSIFASQISKPVRRLRAATQQLATGELNVDLSTDRNDELGELERSFNKMTIDLRHAQEQMVKTHRELAWKEMAKQVAHEIKNPLTPIRLSVQHLRQAYRDGVKNFGEVLETVTSTILDQIDTLNRIASEFSQFARMPERKIEPCNIRDIVREAVALFRVRGLEVRESFEREESVVLADREEFRRAIINIIRNAVQAMSNRGILTVTTRESGDRIALSIADNGPGIPEDVRVHLFEPNFSTKTEGMGLGLSIVKKSIQDMGGTVMIDSTVGMGTTVIISLPLR